MERLDFKKFFRFEQIPQSGGSQLVQQLVHGFRQIKQLLLDEWRTEVGRRREFLLAGKAAHRRPAFRCSNTDRTRLPAGNGWMRLQSGSKSQNENNSNYIIYKNRMFFLQIDGQKLDMTKDAVQGKALDECPDRRANCGGLRCLNGGVCSSEDEQRCLCPMGWVGDQCEIRQCPCNPCLGNSTCLMSANDQMICVCTYGRVGTLCEVGQLVHYSPGREYSVGGCNWIVYFVRPCSRERDEASVRRDDDGPLFVSEPGPSAFHPRPL